MKNDKKVHPGKTKEIKLKVPKRICGMRTSIGGKAFQNLNSGCLRISLEFISANFPQKCSGMFPGSKSIFWIKLNVISDGIEDTTEIFKDVQV